MKTVVNLFLMMMCLILMFIDCVQAAQDATVVVDNAIIRTEPKDKSDILEYLPIGLEVRVSSYPTKEGWYKIRSKKEQYGWIHESYLSVQQLPKDDGLSPEETAADEHSDVPQPNRERKFFIRGFYGIQYGYASNINEIFKFSEFKSMNTTGGELGWFLKPNLALLLRSEMLFDDVLAKESGTNITYDLNLRSYPVMAGLEYYFVKLPPFRLSAGALAGFGFNTMLDISALTLPSPNNVTLKSNPFTFLLKVNGERPLGRTFGIFAELGYRYLVSGELATGAAQTTNGGQVFLRNGVYENRIIDLSGVFGTIGLSVHFF